MSTPGIVGTRSISGSIGDGLQRRIGLRERALHEGHAHAVHAGLDADADVVEARLHLVCRDRLPLVDGLEILRPADVLPEHAARRRSS